MDTQKWINEGYNFIIEFGPKIIGAILIWVIGSWNWISFTRLFRKFCWRSFTNDF